MPIGLFKVFPLGKRIENERKQQMVKCLSLTSALES